MRIIVHQPIKPLQSMQMLKIVENLVNTDLVEREHDNGEGGTTLHMQSGATVDITESFDWWKAQMMPTSQPPATGDTISTEELNRRLEAAISVPMVPEDKLNFAQKSPEEIPLTPKSE